MSRNRSKPGEPVVLPASTTQNHTDRQGPSPPPLARGSLRSPTIHPPPADARAPRTEHLLFGRLVRLGVEHAKFKRGRELPLFQLGQLGRKPGACRTAVPCTLRTELPAKRIRPGRCGPYRSRSFGALISRSARDADAKRSSTVRMIARDDGLLRHSGTGTAAVAMATMSSPCALCRTRQAALASAPATPTSHHRSATTRSRRTSRDRSSTL